MIEQQVAKRYAAALFEAARTRGIIDDISEELTSIRDSLSTDDALVDFLDAPQIRDEEKFRLVDEVFKEKFSPLVYSLVRLTVEKRRSRHLVAIIDQYTSLVEEEKGIVRVSVTTAVPMELNQRDKLVKTLENMTGKKVLIFPRIREEVIGGAVVNLGNMVIDNSIKNKLNNIRKQLLSLRVH
jgi:F-type H+-transporting ATPase subunit delta